MSSVSLNPLTVKSFVSIPIAFLLDKYALGNESMNHNLIFGVSSGIGIYVGNMVGSLLPDIPSLDDTANTPAYYTSQGIFQRTAEIGGSSVVSYYLSKYMMNAPEGFQGDQMYKKLAVIGVTDIASEYFSQYWCGNPLQAFAPY